MGRRKLTLEQKEVRKSELKNYMQNWELALHAEALKLTAETGVKHTVDHVIPLRGPTVCGLHVFNNLQVIPHSENSRKGNRSWPDMPL